MNKKTKILKKEVKITEMKAEIIKYEIRNVNSIQDIRQLKKKLKIVPINTPSFFISFEIFLLIKLENHNKQTK